MSIWFGGGRTAWANRKDKSMTTLAAPAAKKWMLAAAIIVPAVFLATIPWLKNQPDVVVYLFAGIAATITVLCSLALAVIEDRRMDEWHRTAARFASQWGWLTGGALVAILLALPPVHDAIIGASGALAGVVDPDRTLVLMAFMLGFIAVILIQSLCTMVLSFLWRSRKSRAE